MTYTKYRCSKCGGAEYETDEFRATGGFWSKVFDIQNKRFTTVSCTQCHFTEVYKVSERNINNVLDFIFGR